MAVVNHAVEGKNGRQPRFHALVASAESERLIWNSVLLHVTFC